MKNNSQLIDQARAICEHLSYDDSTPNGSPKGMISELCRRLGARTVRIKKVAGGYSMTSLYGQARLLSWKEEMMWRLFGWPPRGFEVLPEVAE